MNGLILTSNIIPAWLVAINMLLAGIMLRVAYKRQLRLISTTMIVGNTMLIEAIVYAIAFQLFALDDGIKILISRFIVITISMSLYLPLFMSYLRSRNRGT